MRWSMRCAMLIRDCRIASVGCRDSLSRIRSILHNPTVKFVIEIIAQKIFANSFDPYGFGGNGLDVIKLQCLYLNRFVTGFVGDLTAVIDCLPVVLARVRCFRSTRGLHRVNLVQD